jgi:serine/threonine-protein kinase
LEIISAIEHAHARRIVHRDIKPENILITEDDHVKIIDFGLARAIHDLPSATDAITNPTAFIGTVAYAAPELLSGGSASTRSDVYSLGVLLYEMVCGEHPFARLGGHALISAILSGSYPACSARNPRVAASIAALIGRCMSREPAARFKDASELAAEFQMMDAGVPRIDRAPPALAILKTTPLCRKSRGKSSIPRAGSTATCCFHGWAAAAPRTLRRGRGSVSEPRAPASGFRNGVLSPCVSVLRRAAWVVP